MNKKVLAALVGSLAFGTATVSAYANDEAPKAEKAEKGKKGKESKAKEDKKAGDKEKSCGADGKSCSGKK